MPFESKSQIAKFGELVKQGKMSQAMFDEWMGATKNPHLLPERIHHQQPKQPKTPKVHSVKTVRVIK